MELFLQSYDHAEYLDMLQQNASWFSVERGFCKTVVTGIIMTGCNAFSAVVITIGYFASLRFLIYKVMNCEQNV